MGSRRPSHQAKNSSSSNWDFGGAALYPQAGTANDGKMVMAGRNTVFGKAGSFQFAFALARFNTNGTLDATFGSGGMVTTTFPGGNDGATSVMIQPDGKIVAAGTQQYDGAVELARYNVNGSLDTSFGSGGEVVTSFAQFPSIEAGALLRQPDGSLILVADTNGSAPNDWLLVRYKANGTLDTSFGNQGVAATPMSGGCAGPYAAAEAVLYPTSGTPNDGKILVVGNSADWELVRYNADGTLDSTFGNGGEEVSQISGNANSVALDAAGRPVVTGQTGSTVALARFNLNGTPDATFGSGGLVTLASPPGMANGVAIYPNAGTANDGKLVVVGWSNSAPKANFLVARFLPSEPEVGSFAASAATVTSGSSETLTASNITDANPGATVTQVAFYAQVNSSNTLLGYGTQTSLGVWTFSFTVTLAPGTYTIFAQAEDSYGVFGDFAALGLTVQ